MLKELVEIDLCWCFCVCKEYDVVVVIDCIGCVVECFFIVYCVEDDFGCFVEIVGVCD